MNFGQKEFNENAQILHVDVMINIYLNWIAYFNVDFLRTLWLLIALKHGQDSLNLKISSHGEDII